MLKNNTLGIIFPNVYDKAVPELTRERLMASVPFASRYRMIDFVLSSMVNHGIDNIACLVKENYRSLVDHIGGGREWDLSRKNGGITIFPPFSEKDIHVLQGRIDGLASIIKFLKSQKEKYVVMSDCNIAYNFDFEKFVHYHIETGADITCAYNKSYLSESAKRHDDTIRGLYYTFDVDSDKRINAITINSQSEDLVNYDMNIYCIERELLINIVKEASLLGKIIFERDVLIPKLNDFKIMGYEYDGYVARIDDMKSYFNENMRLLENDNLDALFSSSPIYTKIRDDNPARYITGAKASNSMVADGCVIEGEIENSILFRGVKIGKGAKVKNCILMQDTVVDEGSTLEYVITDKKAHVKPNTEVKSSSTFPLYIPKGHDV